MNATAKPIPFWDVCIDPDNRVSFRIDDARFYLSHSTPANVSEVALQKSAAFVYKKLHEALTKLEQRGRLQ